MTSAIDRLKFVGYTLLITLGVALVYTILHEGGHALAGLAFGGWIQEVDLNFFNLGAHVNIGGSFSRSQEAVINVSGVGLPLLVWFLLIVSLPKKGSPLILWTKSIISAGTLCSLLAWVVIPFLYLKNYAPAGDDVTRFLANSGLPPFAVAACALILFAGGWYLVARCLGGSRPVWNAVFPGAGKPVPAGRWVLAGTGIVLALTGAWTFLISTLGNNLPRPPGGYSLAATVDLSSRDVQAETIASFTLVKAGDVAILLRVKDLDTRYIDVTLVPWQGLPLLIMHEGDFAAAASDNQNQYRLPAGEYKVVLTSLKSSGVLQVYIRFP